MYEAYERHSIAKPLKIDGYEQYERMNENKQIGVANNSEFLPLYIITTFIFSYILSFSAVFRRFRRMNFSRSGSYPLIFADSSLIAEALARLDNVGTLKAKGKAIGKSNGARRHVSAANQ